MHHWQKHDVVWVYLVGGAFLLMVIFAVIRAKMDKPPTAATLGARVVQLNDLPGPMMIRFDEAPDLKVDGSAIVVKAGDRTVFVIRLGDDKYRAYDTRTLHNKPLKWEGDNEALVVNGRVTVGFDAANGTPLQPNVDDRLKTYLVRVTADGVEITPP